MSKKTDKAEDEPQTVREIDKVIGIFQKDYGQDIIMPASKIPISNNIPTGAFLLDFALMGGVPEGQMTTVYGPPSCGKTTMLMNVVANFQKKHPTKIACWIDTELTFDRDWATKQGCIVDNMQLARPENGQQAVDIALGLMGAEEVGMLVLDSVPGCVSKEILDKSAEDKTMAELARLMGVFCQKTVMSWARERKRNHHVTVLVANQFRTKVGVMFGDTRTLPGGIQINHVPTTKIEFKNKEHLGKDQFGNEVVEFNQHSFKIEKAKHGSSIRSGDFRMAINPDNVEGYEPCSFMDSGTLCVYAKRLGFLKGGGTKWHFGDILEGMTFGKISEAEQYLSDNPAAKTTVAQAVIAMQRHSKGLPALPPDGYLLDWAATED